jgi:dipeptidyl aminopeptidase/acylaminoacyl peptidase
VRTDRAFPAALVVALVLSACAAPRTPEPAPAEPPLIPRSALFDNPGRIAAQLSPDGSRYAYLAPVGGVLNVWVADIAGGEPRSVTNRRSRGIHDYFWSGDGRYLFFMGDNDGDENWALYSVSLESGELRAITPFDDVQVQILEVDPNYPDRILIEMNRRDPLAHDVYRLDVESGELAMVAENPGNVRFWIVDPQMRVRGMHLVRPDAGFDYMIRDTEDGEWRKLLSFDFDDAVTSRPAGFSADGRWAYLLDSRGAETGRLVRMDTASGAVEVLAEDPEYDLGDVFEIKLLRHPHTYDLQAVQYFRERATWISLNDEVEADLTALRAAHAGDFYITSRSHDDRVWFVEYDGDVSPPAYYVYDRDTKGATLLFESFAEVREYPLAEMEPFRFAARDGLEVHGYLSFPVGAERSGLPLVVTPHGGPWYRDYWGYDSRVQWLANRGYVVMSVNYRGSTTYGKEFIKAANHEWGRKMLWDLVDAAQWAVDQGWVDAERIAIYGTSFGGYQALCGAAFTPDFFRAAIDVVGVSNLVTFMNSFPPQWETRKYRFWLRGGDPRGEVELLVERSPYHHADNIKIPILIAQGANDPRVKQVESDQIVERLKANGVEHQYLLFPDEGHGLQQPANRETFFAAAEAFLAKHLGGRRQEAPPEPSKAAA